MEKRETQGIKSKEGDEKGESKVLIGFEEEKSIGLCVKGPKSGVK